MKQHRAMIDAVKRNDEVVLSAGIVGKVTKVADNGEVEVEIATLQADIRGREQRLKELQGLINEVPEVEAQLAKLNRDYNVVKEQYQALAQSRETQKLSTKASDQDQVDFRVLNPPTVGSKPVAPKRLLLLAGVLAAAFGAGGGLCYILAQMKPVFSTAKSLRELVELPVIGSVRRVMTSPGARAQQRANLFAFSAALAALVVVFAVAVLVEVGGRGLRALLLGA